MADRSTAPVVVNVVRDDAQFAALRSQWHALLERCREKSVFMTWEWLYSWWRHFSEGRRLFILAVTEGGRLEGLVPLTRRLRPGLGVGGEGWCLEFLGYREGLSSADWMDVAAVRKVEVLDAVVRYLLRRPYLWEWVELRNIPGESDTLRALGEVARSYGLELFVEPDSVCPYVSTVGDWHRYYATRRGRMRELDRQVRRLRQRGALELVADDDGSRDRHLEAVFVLHQRRQEALGRRSQFSEDVHRSFYRTLVGTCPAEWLDCSVLQLNGDIVAAHFGFRYGGKFYYVTPAFDPAYASLSPGKVLLRGLLERCFRDPAVVDFDFLAGAEPYKYEWAHGERRGYRAVVQNPWTDRAAGKLAFPAMRGVKRSLGRVAAVAARGRAALGGWRR